MFCRTRRVYPSHSEGTRLRGATRGRFEVRMGVGLSVRALVGVVEAGQVVLPGFTSSVASLASAFAGMTLWGRFGVNVSRIAACEDPTMLS